MLKKVAIKWLDENKTHFTQISDSIWDYAELGLQETKSAQLLASEFENTGFQVKHQRHLLLHMELIRPLLEF
jgi:aminobenzoyl-glutamate utilization protein B